MTNFNKKYHSALEVKSIVSYFIRHLNSIAQYTESEEIIQNKINYIKKECEELLNLAEAIIVVERPDEIILTNPDRGINDFIEGGFTPCGDCDPNCNGGNCGGGNCGGCP